MLHCGADASDEDVAGDHTVFRGEAILEIVGIEDLGVGDHSKDYNHRSYKENNKNIFGRNAALP